jgi:type I restriction enzyme R subunit
VRSGRFTEDQLVEQPAIELLTDLGWSRVNALYEKLGPEGTLGRDNQGEVFLFRRLRPALERLNPSLPPLAIEQAIAELTKDRSAMDLVRANRELYDLMKDGVEVEVRTDDGGKEPERVRVIDWTDPAANDFLLVSQFWVTGDMYRRRADLVGFVNGLPLVMIELKASHRKLEQAYDDNLTDYRMTVPRVFWPNGIIILSNGRGSGAATAG